jgi:hypothetical protein
VWNPHPLYRRGGFSWMKSNLGKTIADWLEDYGLFVRGGGTGAKPGERIGERLSSGLWRFPCPG